MKFSTGGANEITVWIEGYIPNAQSVLSRVPQIRDFEIALPDGQILFGQSGGYFSTVGDRTICKLARFPVAPWRERELTLTFTFDDERYQLKFRNPSYKANLPSWTPQPLPITWRDGALAVTLKGMNLEWNQNRHYYGVRWTLKPKWSVTVNGKPADSWFHVGCIISDSGGNSLHQGCLLGEPALKLNGQVSRTGNYPFSANEVRWIGEFDPDKIGKLGSGKSQTYATDGEPRDRGLVFAGVLTPGVYEFVDGKLIRNAPPGADGKNAGLKAVFNPQTRKLRIEAYQTAFVQHRQRRLGPNDEVFDVWQNGNGREIFLALQSAMGMEHEVLTWAKMPDKPFRYGIAKQYRFNFEGFVSPPEAPPRKQN